MMRLPRPLPPLLIFAAMVGPRQMSAQGLTLRAGAANIGNPLIGGVAGGGLLGSIPVGSNGARLLVGAEYLAGTSSRFGIPCAGLIAPGSCAPEPLRDRAAASSGLVGIRLPAWHERRAAVYLGGDLGVSWLRSRTRGEASGREIHAAKAMWRGDLVGEVEWLAGGQRGVGLIGGVAVGGLAPVDRDLVVDGYTPLDRTARTLRGWLGITWRSGR